MDVNNYTAPIKKKHSFRIVLIVFGLVIVLIACAVGYFNWLIKTPLDQTGKKVLFEVKEGQSVLEVGKSLADRGLIRSEWAFNLNAKIKNLKIMPQVYDFSPSENIINLADRLDQGQTNVVKITIPEGWRSEQIGQKLNENNICQYSDFIKKAKSYEGKLFPDTYYFTSDNTVEEIISEMNQNYQRKIEGLNLSDEDLIIASIVEREAINDEERALIAGIYKNRLKIDMKLEADPTVQYGKETNTTSIMSESEILTFKFWQKITSKDYRTVSSPYNTYLISSLPPGPICNPGIKSITNTINYADHDYLYFLQKDGQIYPSKTLEEHDRYRVTILGAKN